MSELSLAKLLTPRPGFDDKSESVESLGALMRGELEPAWLDANYPTKNLQTVVGTVFSRLDGMSKTVGFHLAQSMGGGRPMRCCALDCWGRIRGW